MSCMLRCSLGRYLSVPTLIIAGLLGSSHAFAADVTWGGNYRVELIKIKNPELTGDNSSKSYILNHLTLTPKVVAADGLTIYSRLDILNNNNFGVNSATGSVRSVAGDVLGQGNNPSGGTVASGGTGTNAVDARDSNALSRNQGAGNIAVTSLYLSWVQEFGQLIVGRMPMQFGLGVAFNAGNGMFDHYMDTKDLIAYKVVFGNLSVMPMVGKVYEGNVGDEDDINDYVLQVQYDNPETELSLGAIYQTRIGTFGGNDTPNSVGGTVAAGTSGTNGGVPATTPGVVADGFKNTLIGLFSKQKVGNFRIGFEADMLSGDTGMKTAGGNGVSLNSYGIAGELGYANPDSKLSGLLKVGFASGDDPGTSDTNEGFQFSRNYDVGLLMFNHPLGSADMLRTSSRTGDLHANGNQVRNQIDTEAISNAIYIAPSFLVKSRDNLSWGGTLVYGMLNKDPIGNGAGTASSLGTELDLNVTYKPLERLTWITEVGALLPGQGWKGGTSNFDNQLAYGIVTKAAISF